jgi:hypothetical protein
MLLLIDALLIALEEENPFILFISTAPVLLQTNVRPKRAKGLTLDYKIIMPWQAFLDETSKSEVVVSLSISSYPLAAIWLPNLFYTNPNMAGCGMTKIIYKGKQNQDKQGKEARE